jgi:protein involved in polysaccharide export with SLBB domain
MSLEPREHAPRASSSAIGNRAHPLVNTWSTPLVLTAVSFAMLSPTARLTSQSPLSPSTDGAAAAVVRPGDAVRVTVWRKPEFSGEFIVTADGTLTHPLYRRVVVTGVPLATVESRLNEVLKQYEANPQFVVEALLRVAVGGEVRTPNLYSLRPETSLGEALALAGGATERGRTDRVVLIRDGRRTLIDLRGAELPAATPIRSGDRLVIERSTSTMRDIIGPTVVILGSIAAIANVILYHR